MTSDLVTVYKVVHNLINTPFHCLFTFPPSTRSTRGHPYKLYVPDFKLNCRKEFFSSRVVPFWNSLPVSVVTQPGIRSFLKSASLFSISLVTVSFDSLLLFLLFVLLIMHFVFFLLKYTIFPSSFPLYSYEFISSPTCTFLLVSFWLLGFSGDICFPFLFHYLDFFTFMIVFVWILVFFIFIMTSLYK